MKYFSSEEVDVQQFFFVQDVHALCKVCASCHKQENDSIIQDVQDVQALF
jgi:hypothetical protein